MTEIPDEHMQEVSQADAPADPTITTSSADDATVAGSESAPSADDALISSQTQPEDTAPVHTYQIVHKTANPDDEANHSLDHTAFMPLHELADWFRDNLRGS